MTCCNASSRCTTPASSKSRLRHIQPLRPVAATRNNGSISATAASSSANCTGRSASGPRSRGAAAKHCTRMVNSLKTSKPLARYVEKRLPDAAVEVLGKPSKPMLFPLGSPCCMLIALAWCPSIEVLNPLPDVHGSLAYGDERTKPKTSAARGGKEPRRLPTIGLLLPARVRHKAPCCLCEAACASIVKANQRPRPGPRWPITKGCTRASASSKPRGISPVVGKEVQSCNASACASPAKKTKIPAMRRARKATMYSEPCDHAASNTQTTE
mmetsp:Transcript_125692/g.326386  ORF Transcript_125692/g.326386 Transcript_125692/m.326386 type:complete len:270 (-) Transcript_125692:474-1283(-)